MASLTELIASMKGNASTDKWDIVCSYTVSQLNQFLQAQYDVDRLAKEVHLEIDQIDRHKQKYTTHYEIKFGSPKLSFVSGATGTACLTMPIEEGSSYYTSDANSTDPITKIPGNQYGVEVIVPLAAIRGDTGEIVEVGNVVEFSDGTPHENHVILHFKNEKSTYSINPLPPEGSQDEAILDALSELKRHFERLSEVDYALATVNNTPSPNSESIFTPKSFVLTTSGEGARAVLSLFIQTKESGNDPGVKAPTFHPDDSGKSPISDEYSASIILSYSLITKAFLESQLTASGFSTSFNTATDGISANVSKDVALIASEDSSTDFFGSYAYDGLNVNLKDHPLTLQIKEGELSFAWQTTVTSGWNRSSRNSSQYGTVYITLTLKKDPIKLQLSNDDVAVTTVTFSSSDFTVTLASKPCAIYERAIGCSDHTPARYENLSITFPQITLAFHGFNFLRTTNLLAPGQHIIKVDENKGVQTPHDFLIVGSVEQKK